MLACHRRATVVWPRAAQSALHLSPPVGELNGEARLPLRPIPASAATARQFVEETLGAWGCDDFLDAARLLVSELVTNAVLHARTDFELALRVLRTGVRVEVRDGSNAAPVVRRYEDEAMTGRGLSLVDELSARWGVEKLAGGGKVVWFELDETARPPRG